MNNIEITELALADLTSEPDALELYNDYAGSNHYEPIYNFYILIDEVRDLAPLSILRDFSEAYNNGWEWVRYNGQGDLEEADPLTCVWEERKDIAEWIDRNSLMDKYNHMLDYTEVIENLIEDLTEALKDFTTEE